MIGSAIEARTASLSITLADIKSDGWGTRSSTNSKFRRAISLGLGARYRYRD